MKKVILLAAFGVAGLVSAKSADVKINSNVNKSQEMKKAFDLCGVHVNFYDSEGNLTDSQWYVTDAPTLSSCQAFQSMVKWNLTRAGFSISAE
ncbi:hypothetical protein EGI16_03370 [Chryseobacterium sp. G0240]|uniref:hypothetical protein n=1 Tax=Chryseobacterium sp. G0240 TaxID=2487066 RepID=UPI000F44BBAE|nr:hypothetical protein [Chryseobacterium sp. G0240]ROI05439.1 hypothetical protein EGI16_03370 [Chryseobacterium sp. G0240]